MEWKKGGRTPHFFQETFEGGGRGDKGGPEGSRRAAMHVHAHHQQNQRTHFLSVFSLWSTTPDRKLKTSCTLRPLDTECERDRHDERVRMKRKSVIERVGNTVYWDGEGQWKGRMDQWTWGWKVFRWRTGRVRDDREKPVNMCYSNMDCSNVKHKKQSCRTCRTSVTQTFVSLYGFNVMYPPLGKECFWTLSFVTGYFFFLFCVSTFLILDSGCIVFDVHCTFTEMHCVLYIALFSVSCQAFAMVHLTSSLTIPVHTWDTQCLHSDFQNSNHSYKQISTRETFDNNWVLKHHSCGSRCSFYCPTDSFHRTVCQSD